MSTRRSRARRVQDWLTRLCNPKKFVGLASEPQRTIPVLKPHELETFKSIWTPGRACFVVPQHGSCAYVSLRTTDGASRLICKSRKCFFQITNVHILQTIKENNSDSLRGPLIMECNGKLVVIGPSADVYGTLLDASHIPSSATLFVGWARHGDVQRLLDHNQSKSLSRLAVYGLTSATRAEVGELKSLLRSTHVRGGWFVACEALVNVIHILQGNVSAVHDSSLCDVAA